MRRPRFTTTSCLKCTIIIKSRISGTTEVAASCVKFKTTIYQTTLCENTIRPRVPGACVAAEICSPRERRELRLHLTTDNSTYRLTLPKSHYTKLHVTTGVTRVVGFLPFFLKRWTARDAVFSNLTCLWILSCVPLYSLRGLNSVLILFLVEYDNVVRANSNLNPKKPLKH